MASSVTAGRERGRGFFADPAIGVRERDQPFGRITARPLIRPSCSRS
ncbi:hypothetical protein STAN_0290 [Streptomyces sp. CBMAI 2042]|nr:hypothetical protein STAN_0290 [Streptomyces sp. CBMAI 2042]